MRRRRAVRASLGLALPVTLSVAALLGACTKKNEDEPVDAGAIDAGAPAIDAAIPDVRPDTRYEEIRAALEDAGRACGDGKDLPDCPLQAWMKRYANTMIGFGDLSAIAEVFDTIGKQAPDDFTMNGDPIYPYWASIARDGAEAARAGDIPAAKAACRSCHQQYRSVYHLTLRARPLPVTSEP